MALSDQFPAPVWTAADITAFLDKHFKVKDLFARNPRFLVLVPVYRADERIVAHPEFRKRYKLRLRLNHRANWHPPSEYWLHLFERR